MKSLRPIVFTVIAAIVACGSLVNTAHAQRFTEVDEAMAKLIAEQMVLQMEQKELFRLPAVQASQRTVSYEVIDDQAPKAPACGGCGYCDACLDDPCCYPVGWDAGVQAGLLKMHLTRDPGTFNSVGPEGEYKLSSRVWLGYMGCDGIGARVTHFYIDAETETLVDGGNFLQFTAELETIDAELTYRGTYCDWCLLTSAGGRYFNLEGVERTQSNTTFSSFEGYGPTASIELRRRCVYGLTPFVNARASLLMGTYRNNNQEESAVNEYYETQIGLEWATCECGTQYYIRGAFEAQYGPLLGTTYETSSDNEEDNMEFGLIGFTLSAGMRF